MTESSLDFYLNFLEEDDMSSTCYDYSDKKYHKYSRIESPKKG